MATDGRDRPSGRGAGFESLWINDHFQVDPPPVEAPIFEPFVELAGVALTTTRARLGHLVLAAAYRNAGAHREVDLDVDVLSGGRAVLGIGAGWKEDEWMRTDTASPMRTTRLAMLPDHLEVIRRMLAPGRATYQGTTRTSSTRSTSRRASRCGCRSSGWQRPECHVAARGPLR